MGAITNVANINNARTFKKSISECCERCEFIVKRAAYIK
jgi:hypothetical protein